MLSYEFFRKWLNYLNSIKGWFLNEESFDRLYDTCANLTDAQFDSICKSTEATQGGKPDLITSGALAIFRQQNQESHSQFKAAELKALPVPDPDDRKHIQGLAMVNWHRSYGESRRINPKLPEISRMNTSDYGSTLHPLAHTFYKLLLQKYGEWTNVPLFVKGHCPEIEELLYQVWQSNNVTSIEFRRAA